MNSTLKYLHNISQPEAQSFASLGYDFSGSESIIQNICDDSRAIQTGDTFLLLPRAIHQTHEYIQAAISAGAANMIGVGATKISSAIPCLSLPNMHDLGVLLRRWFQTEQSQTQCMGITGTDGKTSVTWMLREALTRHYGKAWSSGTLGWMESAEHAHALPNTTPSLLTLHRLLAAASKQAVPALVMEVSSHGIAQERIAGLDFNAALWTTLGHDHLEDHGGFDAYASTKQSFVRHVAKHGGTVIYNQDQTRIHQRLQQEDFTSFTYARGLHQPQVNILAWEQELPGLLRLASQNEEVVIEDIPVGNFHAENIAAVAQLLHAHLQLDLQTIAPLLHGISAPPGRMQPVQAGRWQVFVDYAHTPEALQACLDTSRAMTRGRLLLVFGCGGDRDHEKRPQMGAVAAEYADVIWLTSDNPRSEAPESIISEIKQGIATPHAVETYSQSNREKAIADAIAYMCIDDVLIIAGKGHEPYMEIHGVKKPWSDIACAHQYLSLKNQGEAICA